MLYPHVKHVHTCFGIYKILNNISDKITNNNNIYLLARYAFKEFTASMRHPTHTHTQIIINK